MTAVTDPHLTIYSGLDAGTEKLNLTMNKSAYKELGNPEAVKILVKSKTRQIKLVPTIPTATSRKILLKAHDIHVGRVTKLARNAGLPEGIYTYRGNGVFVFGLKGLVNRKEAA